MSPVNKFSPYSVLMSVYARENPQYLRLSVESMFAQSVKPDEFVLVIDGPVPVELSDEISSLCERFKIKTVQLAENVGLGRALNAGLNECSNEIVARMDSDDISFPDRIEKQLMFLEKSKADVVGASVAEFEGDINNVISHRVVPKEHKEIMRYARKRNPFNHPAVVYKKSVVEKSGGYQDWPLFEDYELFARLLSQGAIGGNIEEPLLYMRAGRGMYARRSGKEYVKKMNSFYKRLSQLGFSGKKGLLTFVFPRTVVALLPNEIRRILYQKILHK